LIFSALFLDAQLKTIAENMINILKR
jgi:hypothetical protein